MKIKDIIDPIISLKDKYILAYRIRKCNDMIKTEIRKWKEDGELPTLTIELSTAIPGSGSLTLSMNDLTDLYNFDILNAFLFMDDVLKANEKEDKKDLVALLSQLKSSGCEHKGNITPQVLENIRLNQPGVWAVYQKLLAEEEALIESAKVDNPLNDNI